MNDLISILAIIVSSILAVIMAIAGFLKYRKTRFTESKLEITVMPEIYHFNDHQIIKLLIKLTNKGNTVINPKEDQCLLEIKKITLNNKNEFNLLNINKLVSLSSSPINYIKYNYESTDKNKPYLIEPGITDVLSIYFSTTYKGHILIKIHFVDNKEYEWNLNEVFTIS